MNVQSSDSLEKFTKFIVFNSSFFHQSISIFDNLLVYILSFCFLNYFITSFCQFLEKNFINKTKDIFGGSFDLNIWMYSLYCLFKEIIIFSIAKYLVCIVVIPECLFKLFCLLLRQLSMFNFQVVFISFNVLFCCCFQKFYSVVVIYCFKNKVLWGFSWNFVIIVSCHQLTIKAKLYILSNHLYHRCSVIKIKHLLKVPLICGHYLLLFSQVKIV